jgi:predicted membrane-bound spermidine synthase
VAFRTSTKFKFKAIIFATLTMLGLFKIKNNDKKELSVIYAIGTTGFFGMLINLVLVFAFQILSGYLYYKIGLLIGIFMSGIALGSIIESRLKIKPENSLKRLVFFEAAIITFSAFTAVLLQFLSKEINVNTLIFFSLFICAGWLMGAEFSHAVKICLLDKNAAGQVSGKLYFADLLGGWLAGILTGILFLPVLGIILTCAIAVLLKVSSSLLIIFANGGFAKTFSKK